MTVAELWDTFRTEEDPASPSIDELYQCLKDESTKKHTFEVSMQGEYQHSCDIT